MPAPPFTSSPNVLPASEPDPSPPPPGRTLRVVVRVLLWTLIGIAALHGVLPPPAAPRGSGPLGAPAHSSPGPRGPASQASAKEQAAMATAAAFLREYLTVDGRRAEGPGRFKRYLARGVEMDDGVVPQPGISQSMDLVVPAGVQPAQGGMEVTVVAHLLRSRDGPVEDGGTVAFVVPMVTGSSGTAVGGIPRPAALPVDPGLTSRPLTLPTALARATAVAAGQAVAAVLNGDRAALARLGGGAARDADRSGAGPSQTAGAWNRVCRAGTSTPPVGSGHAHRPGSRRRWHAMTPADAAASPLPERSHALPPGGLSRLGLTIAQRLIARPRAVGGQARAEGQVRAQARARPRSGWHAYRPAVGALMPSWAAEFALTIERPLMSSGVPSATLALLLVRAAGPWQAMACALGGAMREVEAIAGVGPPLPRLALVQSHSEPGFDAMGRRAVQTHLRAASQRGQAVGYRRT